jgi:hypothetical protein
VLILFSVVGSLWVKLKMKKGLFEPVTPIEEASHVAGNTRDA